jgi:hypothetical protein
MSVLARQRNMQHVNLTHGNMIVNKVKIDLNVLGALVLTVFVYM